MIPTEDGGRRPKRTFTLKPARTTQQELACDGCGRRHSSVRLVYRLDPRNWAEIRSRRCGNDKCREGWQPVSFERPYLTAAASGIK